MLRPFFELLVCRVRASPAAASSPASAVISSGLRLYYHRNYLNSIASLAPAQLPLAKFPSASAFLEKVYLPELRRVGVHPHPDCTAAPKCL